ncbi:MAG: hypothetical protein ACRDQZ_13060 [Mycobacteriales bacterium]
MTDRPRIPLVFGGGVDRYSGTTIAEPTSFRDLRNVHLRRGGAELRGGLGLVNDLADDAIIGVFPIRSQGIGVLVTYTLSSREIKLYLTSADGTMDSLVGVVWTLPVDAGFPQVLAAEMVDTLVLAHDEGNYARRQVTKVYDPLVGTITNLQADLYLPTEPPTPVDVFFRGVMTYLEYIVGWGYGSENTGDDNRPEVVRVSLPGQLAFNPEHYFIAGSRGDPVLICSQAGEELMARKSANSYRIVGYDRATFGIFPGDRYFGAAASRLSITIGGINYFWSLDGPRRSEGGPDSEDLELPLDIGGPAPSDLASLLDLADGFACYRPERREIEFIFGQWGYVYHMAEVGSERWSFREYGIALDSSGILYEAEGTSGAGSIGTPCYADFASAVADAPAGGSVTLDVDYTTQNGPLLGGEVAELWAKSQFAGDTWAVIATAAADPVGTTISGPVAREGITYDVAVRFTYLGIPSSGYTSANPFDWPMASRGTVQTAVEAPAIDNPVWSRATATAHGHTLDRTGGAPYAAHGELTSVLEWSNDNVIWHALAAQALAATVDGVQLPNTESGKPIWYRMKDVSSEGVASAYSATATLWAGPVAETMTAWFDPMILAGLYDYQWTWPAGADGTWSLEIIGRTDLGVSGPTHNQAYPATQDFPTAPCGAGATQVEALTRTSHTQYGVTDYGPQFSSGFIAANC